MLPVTLAYVQRKGCSQAADISTHILPPPDSLSCKGKVDLSVQRSCHPGCTQLHGADAETPSHLVLFSFRCFSASRQRVQRTATEVVTSARRGARAHIGSNPEDQVMDTGCVFFS